MFDRRPGVRWVAGALLFCWVSRGANAVPSSDEVARWVRQGDLARLTADAQTFIQVTDTHIGISGKRSTADPKILTEAVREAATLYPKALFVVATGDNGHLKAFLNALTASPLKAFFTPGNCDGAHGLRSSYPKQFPFSHEYGGIQCFFLDTRLPSCHEGWLSRDQLGALHEALAQDAGKIVFLFGHHNFEKMGIMNFSDLHALLAFHRPRYRAIVNVAGHLHGSRFDEQDGVGYWVALSVRDSGAYRVFHVCSDAIIAYDRRVPGWLDVRREMGKPVKPGVLVGRPMVLPLAAASAAKALPKGDADRQRLAKRYAWRANEEGAQGVVMDVRFDEGKGIRSADLSPWGNEACLESLNPYSCHSARFKKVDMPDPWVKHGDGFAMAFGSLGAWHGLAFNTTTLNSPARTNQLTVQADVHLPAGGPKFPYGILAKPGSWTLQMDEKGTVGFDLSLAGAPAVRIACPEPLAYDAWRRVTAVFDGKQAVLYVDGKQAAAAACKPGARLKASAHGLRIGFYARRNWVRERNIAPPARFLLDNLRIFNQAEPPAP